MQSFKRLLKKALLAGRPLIVLFLRMFFKREYLQGRHFENDMRGFIWCFKSIWARSILRLAQPLPFPATTSAMVTNWRNVKFHPDDISIFQSPGTYFQSSLAKIILGKGVFISPNVGFITANHDLMDLEQHSGGDDIVIGAGSWIGMNCVIMPGVKLGERTVVAAGSVVTRSFEDGDCLIAGSPAKLKHSTEHTQNDSGETP